MADGLFVGLGPLSDRGCHMFSRCGTLSVVYLQLCVHAGKGWPYLSQRV
jgi:hypothetical protein